MTTLFIWCPDCNHQVESPSLADSILVKDGKAMDKARGALVEVWRSSGLEVNHG